MGYDGYRRSYLVALYYLSDGQSFLTWAVGNDVGDEVAEVDELVSRCTDWQEFSYPGAVDWHGEGDLRELLTEVPSEATRRQLHHKWFQHDAGDLQIWSRMYEMRELESEGWEGEQELYDRGYVLGRHFSHRTGTRGDLGHVLRENLATWIPVPEYIAREELALLGVSPTETDL
ncbi:hypothetical protein [Modestobacter marinus]|uniref:Uncharacterized protein n=1 Tax=Modestobacter marinus TaxID=477641 RepID=A0A846LRW3_9ACTN|nr:hypothetical protein [Modestobacter marinus]NIH70266.1 hypothetical protein [Modestobacter marinus]